MTWWRGRVEKAITVIGVKAIAWPKPCSKLLQNTSNSVRLMSNCAIQKPPAAWIAMPQPMASAGAMRVSCTITRKAIQLPMPARRDQRADRVVGIAAQIVQQAREQHEAGEVQHAHDEGDA